MDDEAVNWEELELELKSAKEAYELIVSDEKQKNDALTAVINEEKEILAALVEVRRRRSELERKNYERRAEIAKAERLYKEKETKLSEAERVRLLENEKAESFIAMVDYAKANQFEWVQYALPHQWEGALSLAHYGSCILADETGLGKTFTAIMSLDLKKSKKVLIVVPNELVSVFANEVMTYAPHRNVLPIAGADKNMRAIVKRLIERTNEFTLVINYESLWKDKNWVAGVQWDDILIDEAHNIKNEQGLTFNALVGYRYKNCTPITATTILNSPKDMFTPLHMMDRRTFHDMDSFLWTYCLQNYEGKWTFRPGGEKSLISSLKGRFVKRSYLEANVKLPDIHIREILVPRTVVEHEQSEIMRKLSEMAALELETGEHMAITAMIAVITRERQASTYPAGIEVKVTERMLINNPMLPAVGTVIFKVPEDTPSIKLTIAHKRIQEVMETGQRIVVFSQFKTALVGLEKKLKASGIRVARLDGDTNQNVRLEIKKDFLKPAVGRKENYKYDVVLAHYKVGGVGLSLTEATHMIQLDEAWNPATNHQAQSRIHRIGQDEETTVEILRVDTSIDMWMKGVNEQKLAIVNGFEAEVNAMESLKEFFANRTILDHQVEELSTAIDENTDDIDEEFMRMLGEMG